MRHFQNLLILNLSSILVISGCALTDAPSTSASIESPGPTQEVSALVTSQNSFEPVLRTSGQCSVMAPANWIVEAAQYSEGMTAIDPESELAVQLNSIPVGFDFGMNLSMATPPYNDPRLFSDDPHEVILGFMEYQLSSAGLPSDIAFTGNPAATMDGYMVELAKTSKGYYQFIWATFPGDGMNINYILALRVAAAPTSLWPTFGGMLTHIAATQKCTLQDLPDAEIFTPSSGASNASTTGPNSETGGYNPWLGSEWVSDQDTGQNYLVTTNDWSETGPYGPGYYKQSGNDLKVLTPGRLD